MLVVDVGHAGDSGEACYYLTDASGQLQLTSDVDLHDNTVIGRVLFVCRPPDKDSEF